MDLRQDDHHHGSQRYRQYGACQTPHRGPDRQRKQHHKSAQVHRVSDQAGFKEVSDKQLSGHKRDQRDTGVPDAAELHKAQHDGKQNTHD